LGVSRDGWSPICIPQGQILEHLQLSDADLGNISAIGWLVDGAAIMNQIPLCRCSFRPYAGQSGLQEAFTSARTDIMMTLCRGSAGEVDGAGRLTAGGGRRW
jgi:hypothetical protein